MPPDSVHDLTPSSPVAPLPAPTTVTRNLLAPRRYGGRTTRSTSRSTTSSTSRSSSARRLAMNYSASQGDIASRSQASGDPAAEVALLLQTSSDLSLSEGSSAQGMPEDSGRLQDVLAESTFVTSSTFPSSHEHSNSKSKSPALHASSVSSERVTPGSEHLTTSGPGEEDFVPSYSTEGSPAPDDSRKRQRSRSRESLESQSTSVSTVDEEGMNNMRKKPRIDKGKGRALFAEDRLDFGSMDVVAESSGHVSIARVDGESRPIDFPSLGPVSATPAASMSRPVGTMPYSASGVSERWDGGTGDHGGSSATVSGLQTAPFLIPELSDITASDSATRSPGQAGSDVVADHDLPLEYLDPQPASAHASCLPHEDMRPTNTDGGPGPSVQPTDIGPSAASSIVAPQLNEEPIDVDSLPDVPIRDDQVGRRHATPSGPSTKPTPSPPSQTSEPLSAYTCPICFSPPTYATLTPCGHVCCGECLFTAVKTTMQRALYSAAPLSERNTARCPLCRAAIPGWNGKGGGVIGLKPRAVLTL